eukprot:7119342-Pyramimonas_sp.AAC.1
MTLTKKQTVLQPSSSIRPSSDLSMRQADASDVWESTHVITIPAAPRQPEFSAEKREQLSG